MLLNVVVLLVLLEIGARALRLWSADPGESPRGGEPVALDAVEACDWFGAYWSEHHRSGQKRYQPYTLWRSRAFAGETINIDRRGVRRTPGAECEPGAVKVFTFGGSSMWGHGVPDWETIPAHLQAGWQSDTDRRICVENFGERGWVATQGLIELIRQLQQGNVPDVVIFYDGANDVGAAYQSGRSDSHLELDVITDRFERSPRLLIANSALLGLIGRAAGWGPFQPRRLGDGDPGSLGRGTVNAYLSTCDIVESLARTWGFECRFFWQPIITVGGKPLTGAERLIEERLTSMYPDLKRWYGAAHTEIRHAADCRTRLHDLTSVFDSIRLQTYIDLVHLTPEGNRLVAQRILEVCGEVDLRGQGVGVGGGVVGGVVGGKGVVLPRGRGDRSGPVDGARHRVGRSAAGQRACGLSPQARCRSDESASRVLGSSASGPLLPTRARVSRTIE
jgi:lysophospholipase L1-like esterase